MYVEGFGTDLNINVDSALVMWIDDPTGGIIRITSSSKSLALYITNDLGAPSTEDTVKAMKAISDAISARPGGPFVDVLFPENVKCIDCDIT